MTNTTNTVRPLRSDVAAMLLAEASYQGRNAGHEVMSDRREYMTEAEAEQAWYERSGSVVRRRLQAGLAKGSVAVAAQDVAALYHAARAAFVRRVTGED